MPIMAGTPPPASTRQAQDNEDSNVSSPLSDVEDKDAENEEIDSINAAKQIGGNDAQDSDSNLSDANDTEADTERLYDTPQTQRQKDIVLEKFNSGSVFDRTPNKSRKSIAIDGGEATAEDQASSDLEDQESDIEMASSQGDPDESPSKPAKSSNTSSNEALTSKTEGRKRKRSPGADQSDPDQPLRKRTASVGAGEQEQQDDDTIIPDDEAPSTNTQSGEHSATEDVGEPSSRRAGQSRDEGPGKDARSSRKTTRNGMKRRGSPLPGGDDADQYDIPHEDGADVMLEDLDQRDDDHAMDGELEDDGDTAVKNDEEGKRSY
jgi:hypothetical protein